jgi:outer membrane protein TolC
MFNRIIMRKITVSILILIAFSILVKGQSEEPSDSSLLDIPSLKELINAAKLHSPLLKAHVKATEIVDQELSIEKKRWMEYIYIEGTANYGKYDQVVINENTTVGALNTGALTRSEQSRYYGGVGVKLPLSSITSRRNELRMRSLSKEQLDFELQQKQENIEAMIIEQYFRLKYFEERLNTCQNVCQTLEIGYLKAEKDLLNGRIDLNEFAILVSIVGKSKDEYLKAKSEFFAQYYIIQKLTGLSF